MLNLQSAHFFRHCRIPLAALLLAAVALVALTLQTSHGPTEFFFNAPLQNAGTLSVMVTQNSASRVIYRALDSPVPQGGPAAAIAASRRTIQAAAAPGGAVLGTEDPSLTITTNVALTKDEKMELMLAASSLVADSLGKPESYVAVAVHDGVSMLWGRSDAPLALCSLVSLGAINLENNKKVSAGVADLLAPFDIPADRIYVEFRDVARENMGYNRATFGG